MTQLSATRGAPASSEIRNNNQLSIAGSQQLTELESLFQDVDRVVGDSFTRQTVIYHSDAACQFVGDYIENADSSIEVRITQTDTGSVYLYNIPVGENLPLVNDGDMVYAIVSRDGSPTGTAPSTSLTYGNGNLVSNVQALPVLDNSTLFYLPIVMRIDGAQNKKYAHWFFGHGVWAEGSSAQVGLAGTANDPRTTANLLSQRAERRWQASVYEYLTDNIIARFVETRIDSNNYPYTATLDDKQQGLDFPNVGDEVTSVNMLDPTMFLPAAREIYSAELQMFYDIEKPYDENALVEISRDGTHFQQIGMNRLGGTDLMVGTIYFEQEPAWNYNEGQLVEASTIDLDNGTNKYIAQKIIDVEAYYADTVTLKVTKQGSPQGAVRVLISKDSDTAPGEPFYGVNRILIASDWVLMSDLVSGIQDIAFKLNGTVPAGDYHIQIEGNLDYYNSYTIGDKISLAIDPASTLTSINRSTDGIAWVQVSNTALYYQFEGRAYDLRVKVTGQTPGANLSGYVITYGSQLRIERGFINQNVFTFSDNSSEFILDYVPDKNSLACFVRGTGQVFRHGDFTISGKTVTFPVNFFQGVGAVTIEFIQQYGFSVDNSDTNRSLLVDNHFGSPNSSLDLSVDGRGFYLRRPDGILRELAINNNDEWDVYSV